MKKQLNKYFESFLIGIKTSLAFRAEMLLWGIIDSVPLIGILILWYNVVPSGSSLNGYTQNSILTYYVVGFIFRQLSGAHFEDYIINEIKKGTFSTYLLKPISVKLFFSCGEIAWRFMTLITSVLPVTAIIAIFSPHTIPLPSATTLVISLIFIFLAFVMENIYSLMVGAMGFIFENAKSFMHFRWIVGMIFSGILIPFELMPPALKQLSLFLPFRYRLYTPVEFYLHPDLSFAFTQIAIAIIWIFVLAQILNFVWDRAVKNYTAVGQ